MGEELGELRGMVEDLGLEVEMLRSECSELENDLHWSKADCKALEEELSKKEIEILRLKERYEDMSILWEPVYTFLQENRDRLDPVKIEELLKASV